MTRLGRYLSGASLILVLKLILAVPASRADATYYVSVAGDDAASGAIDAPWASPAIAASRLSPGDTLVVLSGTYILSDFGEDIVRPPSGRADAWITIRGQNGHRPILAGRDNLMTAIDLSGVSYLRIENIEITHDPSATGQAVAFRDGISGISAPLSHVELVDLYVHHVDEFGLDLGDVQDLVVRDCDFSHCGFGALGGPLGSAGGWRDVRVEGCRLAYSGHYYRGGDGANRPYDRPDGLGIEPAEGPLTIVDTVAEHNYGDGLDSKAANTTIERCIVANNSCDGLKLWDGPSRVVNTLIYGRGDGDDTPTPWAAVVIGCQREGAQFELEHVTIHDTLGQNYLLYAQYDEPTIPVTISLRNSIVAGDGSRSRMWFASAVDLTIEHCLLYLPQNDIIVTHGATDVAPTALDTLGTGNIWGDARFVSPAWGSEGDYHLMADSPAIDGGTASMEEDLDGAPRDTHPDIGAYEYGLCTFRQPLPPGWHLLSLPLEPTHSAITAALSSIYGAYSTLTRWDCASASWHTYSVKEPAASTLTQVHAATPFWIDVTIGADLVITGSLTSTQQSLCPGWNMIGYPSLRSRAVADALSSIDGCYDTVYAYPSDAEGWMWYVPGLPDWARSLSSLEPGVGYWLRASQGCSLTIEP